MITTNNLCVKFGVYIALRTTGDLMIALKLGNGPKTEELIKLSIGFPTAEKVQHILLSYKESDHHLLGYYNEDRLIGLIGLQANETHGIIKHIAVLNSYQRQGIGKALIMAGLNQFQLTICEAHTDEEGKGFYEKCGFKCISFKGKYNTRYLCKWPS